jgi:hypothetical protein
MSTFRRIGRCDRRMETPVLLISWSSTRENSVSETRTGGVIFAESDDARSLALLLRCRKFFIAWIGAGGGSRPPLDIATTLWYIKLDSSTEKPVTVVRGMRARKLNRALMPVISDVSPAKGEMLGEPSAGLLKATCYRRGGNRSSFSKGRGTRSNPTTIIITSG